MFEGRTITNIKPVGGLVAGQQKTYELWAQGGIVYIENPDNVQEIDKIIKEAKKMELDVKTYLQFMIDEEGILS